MSEPDPIEVPIDGVLDLHLFNPKELGDLIPDYIEACLEKEIYSIRIIHGKGKGVLRRSVQSLLDRNPNVESYSLASERSGWGATVVELKN
ncbi:MAG: Smr/MutS family protein [Gracilimonas sp.]|nr:Smr/MutS family protein [Gracilimonas sp.]